jgi:CheY-like chemotaxis protein
MAHTILVADDAFGIVEMRAAVLEDEGCRVLHTATGEEARTKP